MLGPTVICCVNFPIYRCIDTAMWLVLYDCTTTALHGSHIVLTVLRMLQAGRSTALDKIVNGFAKKSAQVQEALLEQLKTQVHTHSS